MSGGSSKPDPYHQRDPPSKKKHIHNEIEFPDGIEPVYSDVKVVPIDREIGSLIRRQKNHEKVYWYTCNGCHKPFPSRTRRYGKTTSCSLACKYKAQSHLIKGRKHSPEAIERMRKAQQKTWNNPKIAKRRRDAAKTRRKPKQVQRKKKPKKLFEYTCAHCGNQFQTDRKKTMENKYCSQKCVGQSQRKGKYVTCDNPNCSKQVWKRPAHLQNERHYCSPNCVHSDPYQKKLRSETSLGEKNPNWKGGVGRLVGWERMADSIRDRDNHACQACDKEHEEGSSYPVHHMRPERLDGPDEPWNLVTLCPPCHYRADAQEGDYKIPHTPEGKPIRDLADLKEQFENYRKQENQEE